MQFFNKKKKKKKKRYSFYYTAIWNFNESLTNNIDIVNFEQLGPVHFPKALNLIMKALNGGGGGVRKKSYIRYT